MVLFSPPSPTETSPKHEHRQEEYQVIAGFSFYPLVRCFVNSLIGPGLDGYKQYTSSKQNGGLKRLTLLSRLKHFCTQRTIVSGSPAICNTLSVEWGQFSP